MDQTIAWKKRIIAAAAEASKTLRRDYRVSRKGCGRGSGEAPRALKLILLNRIVENLSATLTHTGGDSYTLEVGGHSVPFVFRVTASRRFGETGRPWFNLSDPELKKYKAQSALILVAECKDISKGTFQEFEARLYAVSSLDLNDISDFPIKPSEPVPTALFEIRKDADGPFVFNLTAKEAYPVVRIPENETSVINFSNEESELMRTAYQEIRIKDRTADGAFEPLVVTVDPGSAPEDEVAEYLASISQLYRMLGGSGINFVMTDARFPALVEA